MMYIFIIFIFSPKKAGSGCVSQPVVLLATPLFTGHVTDVVILNCFRFNQLYYHIYIYILQLLFLDFSIFDISIYTRNLGKFNLFVSSKPEEIANKLHYCRYYFSVPKQTDVSFCCPSCNWWFPRRFNRICHWGISMTMASAKNLLMG